MFCIKLKLRRAIKFHLQEQKSIDDINAQFGVYEGPYSYSWEAHNKANAHGRCANRINKILLGK